jgi:DedD protein
MSTHRGRLGKPQRVGLCLAGLLVLSLAFGLGVIVGRQWARPHTPFPAGIEDPRAAARGSDLAPGSTPAAPSTPDRPHPEKEPLTFYQTLTAPVGPVGTAPGAERKPAPPDSRAARARGPSAVATAGAPRPPVAPAARTPSPPLRASAPAGAEEPRAGPRWAVQVGAFKSRDQAGNVQRRLASAGYEVSITPVMAGDGPRFRVRVGRYESRGEAERVAARVRSAGGLSTLVTPQ